MRLIHTHTALRASLLSSPSSDHEPAGDGEAVTIVTGAGEDVSSC